MTRRRLAAIMPLVLGALLVTPPAIRAQTGTETSPGVGQPMPKSGRIADITPQLLISLKLQQHALALILEARTPEELVSANDLIIDAYRYQRAAHSGIKKLERNTSLGRLPASPLASQQYRLVNTSRRHLMLARNAIKGIQPKHKTRIEQGLMELQTAIAQTEAALAASP